MYFNYCKTWIFRVHLIFTIWVESQNYMHTNFQDDPSPKVYLHNINISGTWYATFSVKCKQQYCMTGILTKNFLTKLTGKSAKFECKLKFSTKENREIRMQQNNSVLQYISGADLGWLAWQPISCYYYACDLSYFDVVLCPSSIYTFLIMPTS